MPEKTKYLKLPFLFDLDKLVYDLSLIIEKKWIAHYNTSGYRGDWKVISLFAEGSDDSNVFALSNSNLPITETKTLKKCLYFKEIIESFQCKVLSARILNLGVHAEIKPHRDYKLGYEDHNFRIHIPITTNKNVTFILDDEHLRMLPGECWYTNVNYIHSVKNSGDSDRVHLVIDYERNEWSDKLFFSLAPEESFQPFTKETLSAERIKQMIEELKYRNEPAAKQLLIELKFQLTKLL